MSADLLYPDFTGKTKHYTKQSGTEQVIELTPLQVEALSIVSALTNDLTNLVEVPPFYDPRKST